MIGLPKLTDLDVTGKRVLVRGDLDVDLQANRVPLRLEALIPTLDFLIKNSCKIILIGHKGKPRITGSEQSADYGKNAEIAQFSLRPVCDELAKLLGKGIGFVENIFDKSLYQCVNTLIQESDLVMLENLRFDPGEESNDSEFTKKLASLGDIYVNESFAESHREVSSIVGLPKLLPHAAGLRFVGEIENLSKVFDSPKRPVVVIISGLKEDKLAYIEPFGGFADKILVAGRLPEYLEEVRVSVRVRENEEKLIVANLNPDKEDITLNSVQRFEIEIEKAGTIVLAGPIGKYEEEGHRLGTKRVFEAVADSSAFKIAGGGDTEEAINLLGLSEKFDWISVGGGAMLEFLAKRTLPGIEALV